MKRRQHLSNFRMLLLALFVLANCLLTLISMAELEDVNSTMNRASANLSTTVHSEPAKAILPKRKIKHCKLDNLVHCFDVITQYTHKPNGTGFLESDKEFEDYCFKTHDYFPYCVSKFFQRCSSPVERELAQRLFFVPYRQSMNDFCKRDGVFRKMHLKYSKCIIYNVKLSPVYRSTCIRNFQAGLEYVRANHSTGPLATGHMLQGLCCVHNRWISCFRSMIRAHCGEDEAERVIVDFVGFQAMLITDTLCSATHFGANSETCQRLLPSTFEQTPKGLKGQSLTSYLFSYICPNVAYGVVPGRD